MSSRAKALIAVDIDGHVAELRLLEKSRILPEAAEAVVEHHRHPLGRAMAADAVIGVAGVALQQIGGDIPARLVEHLDAVQRRVIFVTLRQALQYIQGVLDVLLVGMPLANTQDAAVVETVLAARRGMEIKNHPQAELPGPLENLVDDLQAPDHKGIALLVVAAVIGIVLAEQPVADRQAHGVDAGTFQPGKVVAGDEGVPVVVQAPRRLGLAQLDAVGGLVGGLQPLEQTGGDPFLQHQPAAEIDAAQFAAVFVNR